MSSSYASRPFDWVSCPGRFAANASVEHFDCIVILLGCAHTRFAPFVSPTDSDSEEDEPHFYLASEPSGRIRQSAPRPKHNLSLLSLTVMIGKGRLQARTDKKVRHPPP